jgi:hypothetical protein
MAIPMLPCLLAAIIAVVSGEPVLRMTVEPSVLKPEESAMMRCQGVVPAGKMVTWYKKQLDGNPEIIGFNNVISNPMFTDRYEAAEPETIGDEMVYIINLGKARLDDSGDFGCAIMGEPTETIAYDQLAVAMEIERMQMFALRSNETDNMESAMELSDGDEYEVQPGDEYYIRCQTIGSNPAPEMHITFGKLINPLFEHTVEIRKEVPAVNPASGGAQNWLVHDVVMTSKAPFIITPEMSRTELKCEATVPGFDPRSITVVPTLKSFPTVTCEGTLAQLYDQNVKVTCVVQSEPPPTDLTWVWSEMDSKHNNSLKVGESLNSKYFSRKYTTEEGLLGVELIVDRIYPQMFVPYTLQIGNILGKVEGSAVIQRDHAGEAIGAAGSSTASMFLILLTAICAILKSL